MSIAGIFLFTRHGDRMGFYQSPTTYTAKNTNLTVLGYSQEYKNGADLRSMYLNGTNSIQGINATRAEGNQLRISADAGGEGSVIVDSTNALLQGLFPPFDDTITLANGQNVTWNLAQLIQVQTVTSDQDVWFEGWTDCNSWQTRLNDWYASKEFKAQAAIANPFFESMQNILGAGRPAQLQNAWNLFDYLNVESIHNSSVQVTPEQLQYARYWANYHEAGSFTDADLHNPGNIAGQAFLSPLLTAVQDLANSTNPLKIGYMSASYKPFLSLFTMMGLPSPLKDTVVDYASAAVIEVRTDNTLRLLFRNGTEGDFEPFALFGSSNPNSYPVQDFVNKLEPFALNDLSSWCNQCSTTNERGCDTLAALNGTGGAGYASIESTNGHHRVSPVVAGVIGSMVTLAVVAFALAIWLLLGGLVKKHKRSSRETSSLSTKAPSEKGLEQKSSPVQQ